MLKKFKELFAERFFYIILAAMGAFMFYDYIVYEINKNVNSRDDDYIVNLENGDRLNIKESNTKCTKESSSFHLIILEIMGMSGKLSQVQILLKDFINAGQMELELIL